MRIVERLGLRALRCLDPETAHGLALKSLRAGLAGRRDPVTSARLQTTIAGLDLPNPIGAAAGLLVGVFVIIVGAWLLDWQLALTGKGVLYTFLISLLLSLLFGAYPALRAARLDPIIALRGAQ